MTPARASGSAGQARKARSLPAWRCNAHREIVAFADIYAKRLEDAKKLAPAAKTYLDYRYLLDDKSIDAVTIATPQHLQCEHFVAALQTGKHI